MLMRANFQFFFFFSFPLVFPRILAFPFACPFEDAWALLIHASSAKIMPSGTFLKMYKHEFTRKAHQYILNPVSIPNIPAQP